MPFPQFTATEENFREQFGSYCALAVENPSIILFYSNKNTLFSYIDIKDKALLMATENCIHIADPGTGRDKTIESMTGLLYLSSEKFGVDLTSLFIDTSNDKGSETLRITLEAAWKNASYLVVHPSGN